MASKSTSSSFRLVLELCVVIFVPLIAFICALIVDLGLTNPQKPHGIKEHNCVRVPIAGGCEDMSLLSNGKVLMACEPRRSLEGARIGGNHTKAFLDARKDEANFFVVDPADPKKPVALTTKGFPFKDMNWHGVVVTQYAGSDWILVINHHIDREAVEVFKYSEKDNTATFWGSLQEELLQIGLTNELDVLPNMKGVFVTMWLKDHKNPLSVLKEYFLKTRESTITYCEFKDFDPNKPSKGELKGDCQIVAAELQVANGIKLSVDKKYLFVTDDKYMTQFRRNETDNELEYVATHSMATENRGYPDNLFVDPKTGNIWSGTHPNGLKFMRHQEDHSHLAPSEVVVMKKIDDEEYKPESFLFDDGKLLSASSVAVVQGGKVFVGGVVDNAYLVCDA